MTKIIATETSIIEAPLWVRFMLLFRHKQYYELVIDHRDQNKGVHIIKIGYKTYKEVNYIISKELVKIL